ncbi:MAG: ribonuclease III, partial [Oscillospiraceae bacterium]|nr:ribonuclease III [Oscillospiraceae bacterium]
DSILADAVEALLAALYLDGGLDEPKRIIYDFIISDFSAEEHAFADYKTQLQELIQKDGGHTLGYIEIGETGPDHAKEFTVAATLDGEEIARGVGRTKKQAEQNAAKAALESLR